MNIANLPSDIGTNYYGTQNVTDESTWLSWTWSNIDFKGVRICKATEANGGCIQLQGNASDSAKQGFIFNNTAWSSDIRKITIVLKEASSYAPSYSLYVGSQAHPTTTAITPTSTNEDIDGFKVYTEVFDLSNTNATYFTIANDKQGALHIDKIYVESTIIGPVQIDGVYYSINTDDSCASVTSSGSSGSYSGSVEIPSTVTYNDKLYAVTGIGSSAFEGCSDLTSVTIPNSVTSIGSNAFLDCSSLATTAIPDGVITIGEKAFRGCNALTSITVPKSVISIGRLAFGNCNSLSSIQVDTDNPVYDSRDNCNAIIETVTNSLICGIQNTLIPVSVTSIEEGAFYKCEGLVTINIPENVNTIGEASFYKCTKLTTITIPKSVKSIGMYAFRGCSSLTSINIPEGVDSIGRSTFYECESLTSISIPNSVKGIGMYAFYGCKALTSINIPEGVDSIGRSTFYECESLTSISIPNSVKGIGMYAFYKCSGLTSIIIPEGVKSVGIAAFYKCSSLMSITIPNGVTSIDEGSFYNCYSLKEVYCMAELVPETSPYAFDNTSIASATLYVPESALDAYKTTAPWSGFEKIVGVEPVYILGDANGNGEVEIGDVTSVLTLMANPDATGYNNKAADANGNGSIEIGDITTILTIMAGE